MTTQADEALALYETLRPHLADKPPEVVGAILSSLVAIWVARHRKKGDDALTKHVRDKVLKNHVAQVRKLILLNEPREGLP
jgi:hypothetical protein